MRDQRVSHRDSNSWTTPALVQTLVVCAGMGSVEGGDALRVGEFERVNGLVLISDNGQCSCCCQDIQEYLFRTVQILILVHEDVRETRAMRRCRIVADEPESFRDKFGD